MAAPVLDLPRDPDFASKAGRILDLYARTWQGETLAADEYVISADEKTGSATVGTPNALTPPPDFGISTIRTGGGK